MADVKYSLDDNIKQNFLEPLHHLQTKDLKEVMVSIKMNVYKNVARCLIRLFVFIFFSIIVKNCKDDVWITIASVADKPRVRNLLRRDKVADISAVSRMPKSLLKQLLFHGRFFLSCLFHFFLIFCLPFMKFHVYFMPFIFYNFFFFIIFSVFFFLFILSSVDIYSLEWVWFKHILLLGHGCCQPIIYFPNNHLLSFIYHFDWFFETLHDE